MFDKIEPGPFDVRYKVRPDRPKPEKTGVRPSLDVPFLGLIDNGIFTVTGKIR